MPYNCIPYNTKEVKTTASKYKKRADGRYLVQVQTGIQDNGKPKYKNIYGKTVQELEKKVRDFKQELDKGIVVDDQGMTVGKWALHWLEMYKSNLEYYTIEMYKSVINVHIIPTLGDIQLKKLKTHHIQELINVKSKDFSVRTLEKIKLTLSQIIKQAIVNEFIYKDVMLGVTVPKKIKTEKRALTNDEIKKIRLTEFDLKEKAFIYMLLYTGVRRGEILALTKNDIDFTKNVVCINKAIYFQGNRATIKDAPKSQAGFREIPIPKETVKLLKEYMSTLEGLILFPNVSGGLMGSSNFSRFWKKIMNKIEPPSTIKTFNVNNDITPHTFRHTYATTLYFAGVDVKTAQSFLGHSSISITMDIYTHLNEDKKIIAAIKIDDYISQV